MAALPMGPSGVGFGGPSPSVADPLAQGATGPSMALPARLVEEALAQDDQQLRLDEVCAPGQGSADYSAEGARHFEVQRVAPELPTQLRSEAGFVRQGVLPDIQCMWRSFDSKLVLWSYAEGAEQQVVEYEGVSQQIVGVATARPKDFVSGVDVFLVLATPVEVSLHALCFAPGGKQLMTPVRTQHAIATDDVVVTALAADGGTGRIFLGGSDGCIHEFQYFSTDTRWLGRPRKCRKTTVSWNLQSQLPALLRKVSERLFGAADPVVQLAVEGSRGLLFSLSAASAVSVFQLPRAQAPAEDPAPSLVCAVQPTVLAAEASRARAQLFPGLQATAGQKGGAGMIGVGSQQQQPPKLRIVRLLPLSLAQGGSLLACAVVEDGTRIYLRGIQRPQTSGGGGGNGASNGFQGGALQFAAGAGAGPAQAQPQPPLTGVSVHHVRFLDANCAAVRVTDVVSSGSTMLMLCRLAGPPPDLFFPQVLPDGGEQARGADGGDHVVVAVSADLRVVAQRQSRGRTPWLTPMRGLAEHTEIIRFAAGSEQCQAIALAACEGQLTREMEGLYGRSFANSIIPVLGLSELAQQQLLPAPRFVFISNLGVHTLKKVQPLDEFRALVARGDVALLRDFALQYTPEQTCALCFQMLAGVADRLDSGDGQSSPALGGLLGAPDRGASGGGRGLGALLPPPGVGRNLSAGVGLGTDLGGSLGSALAVSEAERLRLLQRQGQALPTSRGAAGSSTSAGKQDPNQDLALLRAEQLLLTPQLANQMGFVQTWACSDAGGVPTATTMLGHSIHGAAQVASGRMRGLCLYLSRILRPLWLSPVMQVSWPARPEDPNRNKRRREEWWPPPPQPAPVVKGSKWQCAWSKAQRGAVQGQLLRLSLILQRCKAHLVQESAAASGRVVGPTEGSLSLVDGVVQLVATSLEALAFLELVSARADLLGSAPCPADALVRFAELTFRDLVCQPEARSVLQQLMRGGVLQCRQLHAKCPRLFSAVDLEVQEAYERLGVVQQNVSSAAGSAAELVRLGHLVQQPLRTLERHAARVDLEEVASRLRAVGALKGLVALCVRIARVRDPGDESLRTQDSTSSRAMQLHYARLECYQVVLGIFEDLFARADQHRGGVGASAPLLFGGGTAAAGGPATAVPRGSDLPELVPWALQPEQAMPLLDALLRHCLEDHAYGADELFHFCMLKWMMQRELPLYRYDSPYLKGFLERHASHEPELLCRYFQQRGRWAEAHDAYMSLVAGIAGAVDRKEQRLRLLQSAAVCARMPGSCRRVEPILRAMAEATDAVGREHAARYF